MRLRARMFQGRRGRAVPPFKKLHFGCGSRFIEGWLNVDVAGSEHNVDLAGGSLPWQNDSFDVVFGQQVVEHLELKRELIPLLEELNRVCTEGAEIWLACPDMEAVCRSYFDHKGADLLKDKQTRHSNASLRDIPTQQMINILFHQSGQHKNLYDYELLLWALERAGFRECRRVSEAILLSRFPEVPQRGDDYASLYVTARST